MGKLFMILHIGFVQIFAHKLRSFLTMLGIILGVASLISMFSIVQGSRERSLKWMEERGGINKVEVYFLPFNQRPPGAKESKVPGLQYKDALALKNQGTLFHEVAIASQQYMICKRGFFARWVRVVGTDENYLPAESYDLDKGIFFSDDDYSRYSKVAIIGTMIEDQFFQGDALGKEFAIGDDRYRVIGVLKEEVMLSRNKQENWMDWKNDIILIPITTMIKRIKGSDIISEISFKVDNVDNMELGMEEAKEILLRERFNNEDFILRSHNERAEEWRKMREMWNLVLGAIASISLIVGGIGIMNTLLSNISERIREIGIRKAIGAKKRDIMVQFLMESIVLSCVGGILGVLVGYYAAGFIQKAAEIDTSISFYIMGVSFSFSVFVGIIFGILPSVKAAKLDPIECLRYE